MFVIIKLCLIVYCLIGKVEFIYNQQTNHMYAYVPTMFHI